MQRIAYNDIEWLNFKQGEDKVELELVHKADSKLSKKFLSEELRVNALP